jgi:hypothetical protein
MDNSCMGARLNDRDEMIATCEEIVRALPELQSQFDENVADNHVLLPHLFFGEVSQWANTRAASQKGDLQTLVSILDRRYLEGDPLTVNLILVSFLENLDAGTVVERMLSPRLAAEYEEFFPERSTSQ